MNVVPDVPSSLLPALETVAREAGALALAQFRPGERTVAQIWSKAGGSPVTAADLAVDALLNERLTALLPAAGWLSEETIDDPARLGRHHVWVVDPIDGTRAFMNGHPDWSISIALLAGGRPVLAVLFAPAHDHCYEASLSGGVKRDGRTIAVSPAADLAGRRVAGPKSLVDRLEEFAGPVVRLDKIPSLALRIARVAEGSVECGLVSGQARDWDIAAADLLLTEAGGALTGFDGEVPRYNGVEPVHGELAAAARQLHPALIKAMRN